MQGLLLCGVGTGDFHVLNNVLKQVLAQHISIYMIYVTETQEKASKDADLQVVKRSSSWFRSMSAIAQQLTRC
jgi:hypothetical protein